MVAANRAKENALACKNPQKTEMEAKNLTSPNTAKEESEPPTTAALAECNLSEEKCKLPLAKIESDVTVDQQRTDEKEKEGEERAEGDSQPDPAVMSEEEGKHD